MIDNILKKNIGYLDSITSEKSILLKKGLGISTFEDILYFFPNKYIDKTKYYKIADLINNKNDIQIIGKIIDIKEITNGKSKRLIAFFSDESGIMELVWFKNYKWIINYLKKNQFYVIFGKPSVFNNKITIPHPEIEILEEHRKKNQIQILPSYRIPEALIKKGINNKFIQKSIIDIFSQLQGHLFEENLSSYIISKYNFPSKNTAILNIHFPKNNDLINSCIQKFKFEELFFLQLSLLIKKIIRTSRTKGLKFTNIGNYFNDFYGKYLPFELTNAQKKVLKEIRNDVAGETQMNRLLQGDVGSGKTMVAFMSMLIAIDNGYQACMIAPTEILAKQHFEHIKNFASNLKIQVALLTGSSKTSDRKVIHNGLVTQQINILIGTHAILEDSIKFKNLGLGIIDEQHRFGVAQRAKLWSKNTIPPHILVMTATPIPRTLAMSLYGDLDISVIDELPKGRKPIKTIHKKESNRLQVFHFIKKEIEKGRQIYIVYPLIEESKTLDYKNLMDGFVAVSEYFPKPKYQISIIHGKMNQEEKDYEMNRFIKNETQIMISTTVIEVGVNIPNASVMVIENSERFGLSQLHQLRGRVGRGAEQSFCILMSGDKLSNDSRIRLKTMCETNDGFEISEVDLKLRGAGDLAGTQQSGNLNLKIADIIKDQNLLITARNEAIELLRDDPKLNKTQNICIRNHYLKENKDKMDWEKIS